MSEVLHNLSLGSLFVVEQRRHQLRLEFVRGEFVALAGDAVDLSIVNRDARFFRAVVALGSGSDLDAVLDKVKAAERRLAVFIRVACPTEKRGDFFGVGLVAVVHRPRQGIDLGRITEHGRAEALRDDAVVLDVEVAKESAQPNRHHEEDNESSSDYRVARQATPSLTAVASALWDLYLNGHVWTRHSPKKLPAGQTMGLAQRFDPPANSLCPLPPRSFQSCAVSGGDDFHCTAALVNKKKPAVHAGL